MGRLRRRLHLTLGVAVVLGSLYAGRLFELQALDAPALSSSAVAERTRERPLPAHRGDLVDAEGQILATTVEKRHIVADQTLVADYEDPADPRRAGARAAAAELSPILGVDVETLTDRLDGDDRFVYVQKDVEPYVWRKIRELRVPGLFPESASRRTYPAGSTAGGVLGFVDAEGNGAGGLELAWDEQLAGTDGYERYERSGWSSARPIPLGVTEVVEPVDGDTVHLTIDRDLQFQVERTVLDAAAEYAAESVTAVVLDATTAEVLALATVPGFDPNDPGSAAAENLGNRAVSEVFEPGSTSKVITVAAVLEEGAAVPTTPFTVADTITRGDTVFTDSHPHPVEQLTLAGVLVESSNVGTILAAESLDNDELHGWFEDFGYGERTGLGLPGESPGLLADPGDWSASQRYTVMFGQGVSTNAIQVASVYQTIANDGVRVRPTLVAGRTTPQGRHVAAPEGGSERVLSTETAAAVSTMLESVVTGEEGEQGTGYRAAVPGYRVAGKTGTAERYDDACGGYCGYTASFVGFAPADDPQVVVAITVQDPTNGSFGGAVAAPVFSEVMTAALAAGHVPATGTEPEPYPLRW